MKYLFLLLLPVVVFSQAHLQGVLVDSIDNQPLVGANIVLLSSKDSSKLYFAVSNNDGSFALENVLYGEYFFKVSFVGYQELVQKLLINRPDINLGFLKLSSDNRLLKEVKVEAKLPIGEQKGDTVELNANAFKVNRDGTLEDLVRKMPGITVENGSIKAQGETVQRVFIDGKEFFGDDALMALRNLPAEIVDKVQIFDQSSDQSRFTGFYDGNTTKALNIVTRRSLQSGQFGKIYGGHGSNERYHAGATYNSFREQRKITFLLLSNNINQQNFSSQDLTAIADSRGTNAARARTMGLLSGMQGVNSTRNMGQSSAQNFLTSPLGGITSTQSVGVNYIDKWNAKTQVSLSYFFNYAQNTNKQQLTRAFFLSSGNAQSYKQESIGNTVHQIHRISGRIEHKFDSSHSILLVPRLNFQTTGFREQVSSQMLLNDSLQQQQNNRLLSDAFAFYLQNEFLYRYAFPKKGRTCSFNLNTQVNSRQGESHLNSQNDFWRFYQWNHDTILQLTQPNRNAGQLLGATVAYTEPLFSDKSQVMLEYQHSYSFSNADRRVRRLNRLSLETIRLDSTLSNTFENILKISRFSGSYRYGNNQKNINVSTAYQQTQLLGNQIFPSTEHATRTFHNFLPSLFVRLDWEEGKSARIIYRTSINAPTIQQLQSVVDNTNPILLRAGNPFLKQEYVHFGLIRYSVNNIEKASSLFSFLAFTHTQNYIGSATWIALEDSLVNGILLRKGAQITTFQNIGAQTSLRGYFSYGVPLFKGKFTINTNSSISYAQTPSSVNNIIGFTYSTNFTQGVTLASNISEKVDFTIGYSAQYNWIRNSLQASMNNNFLYHNATITANWVTWKSILLQTQASFTEFAGLTHSFNQNFTLWNLAIGKKIFAHQNGELKITVFDVLNQNNSVSRNVTDTYVEDTRITVLRRYFLLTFTYNFRKFS
ncbi:MAG: outer membrane beta-barrel protein [Cytophagales bacterium]|nr:outer membrane beta-barrel protein [Cytophagales bacterium]MDW8384354.1 TonB-dependent receptor [Flammeovirgaceae bacterium]